MCKIHKLELEFEIVTLSDNIGKLDKLGFRTTELQNRLEYCFAAFEELKSKVESDDVNNYFDFTNVNRIDTH